MPGPQVLLSKRLPAFPPHWPQTADRKAARRSATPSSEGSAGGLRRDLQEEVKTKREVSMEDALFYIIRSGSACRSFTPDMTECVMRFAELQQATVFAQFGDEG